MPNRGPPVPYSGVGRSVLLPSGPPDFVAAYPRPFAGASLRRGRGCGVPSDYSPVTFPASIRSPGDLARSACRWIRRRAGCCPRALVMFELRRTALKQQVAVRLALRRAVTRLQTPAEPPDGFLAPMRCGHGANQKTTVRRQTLPSSPRRDNGGAPRRPGRTTREELRGVPARLMSRRQARGTLPQRTS